jgi:ubiquinol-cytochrome c reductase cytochrome b subunit
MAKFVKKDVSKFTSEQKEDLQILIAAASAEAELKSQRVMDEKDLEIITKGRELLKNGSPCADCHQFRTKDEDATGPDLTGYGSREWLIGLITNPGHIRYYGKRNDRMPAFGDERILDAQAIALVADWLRGDWFEPPSTIVRRQEP